LNKKLDTQKNDNDEDKEKIGKMIEQDHKELLKFRERYFILIIIELKKRPRKHNRMKEMR